MRFSLFKKKVPKIIIKYGKVLSCIIYFLMFIFLYETNQNTIPSESKR